MYRLCIVRPFFAEKHWLKLLALGKRALSLVREPLHWGHRSFLGARALRFEMNALTFQFTALTFHLRALTFNFTALTFPVRALILISPIDLFHDRSFFRHNLKNLCVLKQFYKNHLSKVAIPGIFSKIITSAAGIVVFM